MAQNRMLLNGKAVKQPDEGLKYNWEVTYTDNSDRTRDGVLHDTPLFTTESWGYEASDLTLEEMSEILEIIIYGKHYSLFALSPYYGEWRTVSECYTGKGSLNVGSWRADKERYDSLSFNIIGVKPL